MLSYIICNISKKALKVSINNNICQFFHMFSLLGFLLNIYVYIYKFSKCSEKKTDTVS